MKNIAIYSVVSLALIVVALLIFSEGLASSFAGVILALIMRYVFTTPKGKKWWKTWYKVSYGIEMYLTKCISK